MRRKLTVITDESGRVIATQVGHGDLAHPASGITGQVVAGPGQRQHKFEFDVPAYLSSSADINAFHERLGRHLAGS